MSTIREVAAFAKVSTATVSRVLNEDKTYKITDDTRERVWQAVAELGYNLPVSKHIRKTRNANTKEKKENSKIGCVISTQLKQFIDPYFMTVLSSAEDYLKESGYSIAMITTSHELQNMYLSNTGLSEELDGLILMDSLDEGAYRFIRGKVKHLVGIDTTHKELDNVGYDHFGVSEMAVNYLHQKGYREIGFIGGSNLAIRNFKRSRRLIGYRSTMELLDLPINPQWVLDTGWGDRECVRLVSELCAANNLPRAFYVASDLMAIAALEAFANYGIKVPEEVAIIGVTDINIARYANPPLTTIALSTKEMGIQAAKLLIQHLEGEKMIPRRILLPYSIVERESC